MGHGRGSEEEALEEKAGGGGLLVEGWDWVAIGKISGWTNFNRWKRKGQGT